MPLLLCPHPVSSGCRKLPTALSGNGAPFAWRPPEDADAAIGARRAAAPGRD